MIVARLKKKTGESGRNYLAGSTVRELKKGVLVVLMKSRTVEGQYDLLELGPRRVLFDKDMPAEFGGLIDDPGTDKN